MSDDIMSLAELDSRLSKMTDADLRRHAMDGYREYFKKFYEEQERAEKAEAKVAKLEQWAQDMIDLVVYLELHEEDAHPIKMSPSSTQKIVDLISAAPIRGYMP